MPLSHLLCYQTCPNELAVECIILSLAYFHRKSQDLITLDMKIVIGGSSGLVGAELVRQALTNPSITSIRRETALPPSAAGANDLTSIVCDNFDHYFDDVLKQLDNVDACFW